MKIGEYVVRYEFYCGRTIFQQRKKYVGFFSGWSSMGRVGVRVGVRDRV